MRAMAVATLKAGVGQFITLMCGAVFIKLLAVMVGPAGVGLFSVLRHAQQTLGTIVSFGGQSALVQGAAAGDSAEKVNFIRAALWVTVITNLLVAFFLYFFASELGNLLLGESHQAILLSVLLPVFASALLVFLRGILNAKMDISAVVWTNIITAVSTILVVYPLSQAYLSGNDVALTHILTASFFSGSIYAFYCAYKKGYLTGLVGSILWLPNFIYIKRFLHIAIPSLLATFVGMATLLFIRSSVLHQYGLSTVGYFDAAWSISAMYLTLFLTSLQTYLLPALSGIKVAEEGDLALRSTLHMSIVIAVPLITCLIVFKSLVINTLYSQEFLPAIDLLRWTLLGDIMRVASWVLATALVARASMRAFLYRELIWNVTFAGIVTVLLPSGIAGVGPAYVISYAVYLASLIRHAQKNYVSSIFNKQLVFEWLLGALLLLLVTIVTWNERAVSYWSFIAIPLSICFSWGVMTCSERTHLIAICMRLLSYLRKN